MFGGGPIAHLPREISLTLEEVAVVMAALDIAEAHTPTNSEDFRQVRTAISLLTEKLWPELGDIPEE